MSPRLSLFVGMDPGKLAVNRAWRAYRRRDGSLGVRKSQAYKGARAKLAEAVHLRMMRQGMEPLEGPLVLDVKVHWKREHQEGPAQGLPMGDVDAPLKGILDALEDAGAYAEDAQVVSVCVSKAHSKSRPGVFLVLKKA